MYRPKENEDFWIAHDKFRMDHSLRSILLQVKTFMDNTKEEIVIMDFHRFPEGFKEDAENKHNRLLQLVEETVGHHLAPYDSSVNYAMQVGTLVKNKRRLIVAYAERALVHRPYLYPAVRQLWANTDRIEDLKTFLADELSQPPSMTMVRALMAHLTIKISKLKVGIHTDVRISSSSSNHMLYFLALSYHLSLSLAEDAEQ